MKRQWGIGVGAASVLIIFVLLCLTVFATLSLVSAQADLRLAQRAAQTTAAYYDADGKAATIYCALTDAASSENDPFLLENQMTMILGDQLVSSQRQGDLLSLSYRVPIDSSRAVEVALDFAFSSEQNTICRIAAWRTVQIGGWAEEQATLELWQSGLAKLPNLEG